MKSILSLCLLLMLSLSVFAQKIDPGEFKKTPKSKTKTTSNTNNNSVVSKTTSKHTTKQKTKHTSNPTNKAHVNAASTSQQPSTTRNPQNPAGPNGVGEGGKGVQTVTTSKSQPTGDATGVLNSNGQQVTTAPAGSTATHVSSGSSGLSGSAKIGIGVGVGIGAAAIASTAGLILFLRRRRRNPYNSEQSAGDLRNRPAMSSGAPALAGVSEMGRSISKHSLPRTPSQHSLVNMQDPHPEPVIDMVEPSQLSIARAPTYHSVKLEKEYLMPAPPAYDEAPSPLEPRNQEPVSPMSPVSPVESWPPSPLHDYER